MDDIARSLPSIKDHYDIFLAHDIDDAHLGKRKISFYDAIAQVCEKQGRSIFVPCHFTGFPGDAHELGARETYVLLNEVALPRSQLFLCYLGINAFSVGAMDSRAKLLGKEIIYFYEQGTRLETIQEVEEKVWGIPRETEPGIPLMARVFFHRSHPSERLSVYPGIKSIIEFTTPEEAVQNVGQAVGNYFKG